MGDDGTCDSFYGTCNTTYGTCNYKCVGGNNHSISCAGGGDGKGCTASGDSCIAVSRCTTPSGSYSERCCSFASTPISSPECIWNQEEGRYICSGREEGTPCSKLEADEIPCDGGTCEGLGRYILDSGFSNWRPPTIVCLGVRGNTPCAIAPIISNIKVNGNEAGEDINIIRNGFVSLTFNTVVDKEQLPLVEYVVDWGDGSITTVAGAEMNHRPERPEEEEKNPHEVYHLYNYWDLVAKEKCIDGVCDIKPKIKIKDNWGWCNGGTNANSCPDNSYVQFGANIVVKEK